MKYLGTTNDNLDLIPKSALTDRMLKSVYDTDNDGVVDDAEKLGGQSPDYYAKATNGIYYAKTAGNGVAQVATIAGITQYYDGLCVALIFNVATRRDATININNLGAVPLRNNTETASSAGDDNIYSPGGAMRIFVYDSANSLFRGVYDYSTDARIHCVTTEGSNVAKQADRITQNSNYFHAPCYQLVYFNFDNTAQSALTLNLWNGPYVGAQAPIYINGEASSATNYTLPKGLYLVLWDGTNYYVNTDGTLPGTQAPLTFDSTPTYGSDNPVTSDGVYSVVRNRNLLDNGWFTVNQRGAASYTSEGYTVDRWKLALFHTTSPSVQPVSNGLRISGTSSTSCTCRIHQSIENAAWLAGKTVTVSCLIAEKVAGTGLKLMLSANTGDAVILSLTGSGLFSGTTTLSSSVTSVGVWIGQEAGSGFDGSGDTDFTVSAVKLELGSVSTLANDAPPDYGEELTRCIYSTVDSADTYANTGFARSNRNLLDNPFFTVNQRGSASYTSSGYTVDRWQLAVWNTTAQSVTVNTNGITLSGTASGANTCLLRQTMENASQYAGKTVTVSVLVGAVSGRGSRIFIGTNANDRFASFSISSNRLNSITVVLPDDITSLFVQIGQHASSGGTGNTSIEILAVKLELGSVSTLANDTPPGYGEELTRCIYSTADPSDTYANAGFGFARSNRNLLDNAYFVGGGSQQGGGQFPINQRGQTSYQTNGYTIDRWALANAFICTPESNGLRLNPNNQNNRQFIQSVENAQQYAGKTLTLSVMIPENTASLLFFQVFGTVIDPGAGFTGLYSRTITAPNTISDTSVKIRFNANYADTGNALISAIKLELGPIQTLAHQENGVWVLNDVPNYEEEFEHCVTSHADSTDTYANQAPASMRGFVPLFYTGTMPANGGEVNQPTVAGYNEYYLVDFQYVNANGYVCGLSDTAFSVSPFIQYAKNTPTTSCRIRFTITSNSAWNGRTYYVLLMAR